MSCRCAMTTRGNYVDEVSVLSHANNLCLSTLLLGGDPQE